MPGTNFWTRALSDIWAERPPGRSADAISNAGSYFTPPDMAHALREGTAIFAEFAGCEHPIPNVALDILVGFGVDTGAEIDRNVRAPIAMASDFGKS